MNNLQISQRDFCQPPPTFSPPLDRCFAGGYVRTALRREGTCSAERGGWFNRGGVLDTPKWRHGDEAGDEERERFKRLFLGGRGVMCEIFGGVAFCENMSFPFSDFIWSFTWIMLWKKSCTSWDMKLMQDFARGRRCLFLMIHLWKNPFQHRILVLSCS